uniref:hypothetical protein n=1 Tax=Gluconobacter thailandicus TaxID=257438 RepID=UPI0018D4CCDB|nr:hypothetical protein [Gluconobacter thailandicus]
MAEHEANDFTTGGAQFDLSSGSDHTIRAGLVGQYTASMGTFYTNSRNMQPSIWITSPSRTSVRT